MPESETSPPWPPLDLVRWYESKIAATPDPWERWRLENELISHYPPLPGIADLIIAANKGSDR